MIERMPERLTLCTQDDDRGCENAERDADRDSRQRSMPGPEGHYRLPLTGSIFGDGDGIALRHGRLF
jgi:hypothetical protein